MGMNALWYLHDWDECVVGDLHNWKNWRLRCGICVKPQFTILIKKLFSLLPQLSRVGEREIIIRRNYGSRSGRGSGCAQLRSGGGSGCAQLRSFPRRIYGSKYFFGALIYGSKYFFWRTNLW